MNPGGERTALEARGDAGGGVVGWPRFLCGLAAVAVFIACAPEREAAPERPARREAGDPCYPPSEEAAVTGHWPIPPTCLDSEKGK